MSNQPVRSIRHPPRGSPIEIDDPESPARVEQQLLAGGTYVDFTWALTLNRVAERPGAFQRPTTACNRPAGP
jgi:hypothetical protein